MNVKTIIRKIVYGVKADSSTYIKYLKKKGMKIGKNVTIYVPTKSTIDETRPWMINIGNNVEITEGVIILTHGYDWAVLKNKYGDIVGSAGKVEIGNNVFIGMNAIILKNVKIGNNCIVGAGAVLTGEKEYPDDSIIAGNPAQIIGRLDDYYKKRKKKQLKEALECYQCYIDSFSKVPPKEIFREFFWLFEPREGEKMCDEYKKVMNLGENGIKTKNSFLLSKPIFNNYNEFISYCSSFSDNEKTCSMDVEVEKNV